MRGRVFSLIATWLGFSLIVRGLWIDLSLIPPWLALLLGLKIVRGRLFSVIT